MEKQTGIWQKFKEDMKQNNAKFAADQKKNIRETKVRHDEIMEEGKAKRASIERPIKEVMKTSNTKFAADHQKNIGQTKERTKAINAEAKASRASIERPTADYSKMSGNKFLMILWGTVLSIPLLIIGVILFIMAGLLFWDVLFGL